MNKEESTSTSSSHFNSSYDIVPIHSATSGNNAAGAANANFVQEHTPELLKNGKRLKRRKTSHEFVATESRFVSLYQLLATTTAKIQPVSASIKANVLELRTEQARHVIKRQSAALAFLLFFGIGPFVTLEAMTMASHAMGIGGIFSAKTRDCGTFADDPPQNSTVSGIEALFLLDINFGSLTFSQAKLIDITWDFVLGRGWQLIAWWASYKVFTDVLLSIIQRHPTTYKTFLRIGLEGASLGAIGALGADLFRTRSKRTTSTYLYMLVSILYVLNIPILLSAVTGYNSTQVPWIDLEGNGQLVAISTIPSETLIFGTKNETFSKIACSASVSEQLWVISDTDQYSNKCECQVSNGAIMTIHEWRIYYFFDSSSDKLTFTDCNPHFEGNTEHYTALAYHSHDGETTKEERRCSDIYDVDIDGKVYDARSLNVTQWEGGYLERGYCHNGKGYRYEEVRGRSRCLPDTINETYTWGFSTMMAWVVVLVQFTWALTMYAVWQTAQVNSKLVRNGYSLTQLRTALALATAARLKTGLKDYELVREKKSQLRNELYGSKRKKIKKAEVYYEIFCDESGGKSNYEGLRERNGSQQSDEP